MANKRYTRKNTTKTFRKTKKFDEENYNSDNGMLTTVWGPMLWSFLHCISFNYPVHPSKEQKIRYYDFIKNLRHILPCGKCRENLKTNFKKLPLKMLHMESRETFSKYVYDLHELINTMLCKKSGLTYENVREIYENFRARCSNKIKTNNEKGCVDPLFGKKTKCVIKIVPQETKCDTFQIG
jgi:hypothetical protein